MQRMEMTPVTQHLPSGRFRGTALEVAVALTRRAMASRPTAVPIYPHGVYPLSAWQSIGAVIAYGRRRVAGYGGGVVTGVHRLTLRALLLAVLLGLALMHTFGHAAHTTHPHPIAVGADVHAVLPAAGPTVIDAGCHGCGEHQPWQVFTVCVAVLSALVVLAFALLWLRASAGRVHPPRPATASYPVSRGPPAIPPLRIRLAQLSVLRT